MTKPEQVLILVERKLQVAYSASLLAQHSTYAKVEKARNYFEKLEKLESNWDLHRSP